MARQGAGCVRRSSGLDCQVGVRWSGTCLAPPGYGEHAWSLECVPWAALGAHVT